MIITLLLWPLFFKVGVTAIRLDIVDQITFQIIIEAYYMYTYTNVTFSTWHAAPLKNITTTLFYARKLPFQINDMPFTILGMTAFVSWVWSKKGIFAKKGVMYYLSGHKHLQLKIRLIFIFWFPDSVLTFNFDPTYQKVITAVHWFIN